MEPSQRDPGKFNFVSTEEGLYGYLPGKQTNKKKEEELS